jgi:hypothetical protein
VKPVPAAATNTTVPTQNKTKAVNKTATATTPTVKPKQNLVQQQ